GRAPDAPGRPLDRLLLSLAAAALAALWGGYWRLLRRGRAWRRLRYALIAIDVVGAVRPAFWLGSGVLAPALRGSGLTPEAAGRVVPPRVAPVTSLIVDIRGYTTLAEPLGPREAVARRGRGAPQVGVEVLPGRAAGEFAVAAAARE